MRTLRPTVLSLALSLVLVACAGESGSQARTDLEVDADLDTMEVLASSEATLADLEPESDEEPEDVGLTEISAPAVEPAPEVPAATFSLRRGETLAHYARWAELPVETIATTSGLDLDGRYPVGVEVSVPIGEEGLEDLIRRREAHHKARADAYLASRGGSTGEQTVEVRTGDTAWSIAKDNEAIPVWLLESFNPSIDLDRLRPGQELIVPRIGEGTVASVEEPEVDLLADEADIPVEAAVEVAVDVEVAEPVAPDPVEEEIRVLPEEVHEEYDVSK